MHPFSDFCSPTVSVCMTLKRQSRFRGKGSTQVFTRRRPSKLQPNLQMFNGFSAVPRQTKSKQPVEVGAVNVKTVARVIVRKTSKAKGPVAHLTLELRKLYLPKSRPVDGRGHKASWYSQPRHFAWIILMHHTHFRAGKIFFKLSKA